ILGDSLYACEPVFKMCDNYRWKYIIRFKEGSIKSIADEFKAIKKLEKGSDSLYWVNDISYKARGINMMESTEELPLKKGEKKAETKTFVFITNIKITNGNVKSLESAGRCRWMIENEGFNNQKNIRYDIEHVNSYNYNAMKNHYL